MTESTPSPSFWSRLKSLHLWLPLAMMSCAPILTDFLINRYEVSAQDLVLPILLNLLTAVVIVAIFYRYYIHDHIGAIIAALIATLIFTNDYETRFSAIDPLFKAFNPIPSITSEAIFSLFFILVILGISYWVGKKLSQWIAKRQFDGKNVTGAITLAVTIIFLFQFFPTVSDLVTEWPQFFYHPTALPAQPATAQQSKGKPDVYYIVLDRYASQSVFQNQFKNFDNSEFINFLQNNGFYTNPQSHNSYPYTAMSIAATMDANYHTDMIEKFAKTSEQILFPYFQAIRNSPVVARFKSFGYKYVEIGNWYETSNQSPLADTLYQQDGQLTLFNHQYVLDSLSKSELTKSVWWRFIQQGLSLGRFKVVAYTQQDGYSMALSQLDTIEQLANQPSGGRFIFAHILVPHDPYYFNADGSKNPDELSDDTGELIKDKYVNQVKFINSQMKDLINQIKKASNNQAVIVLQSDEGPYPIQLNEEVTDRSAVNEEIASGSMLTWSDTDLQMKLGNLAAYYIPGVSQADFQAGGDTINIFRLVLNTYFGSNLPYLPKCYYAYPNGRAQPFVYTDITQRLTGQANASCPANSDFKGS